MILSPHYRSTDISKSHNEQVVAKTKGIAK